jgi:hypothetical protein
MTEKQRQNTGGGHPLRYRGAGDDRRQNGKRKSPAAAGC